ncbi:MAG: plasmid pRiA4b ORF-3 family protein [Nitrospirae bacterium]|nr:plasmid pRiA4b ORF-3 family protein [Nitrospirota bacterium]
MLTDPEPGKSAEESPPGAYLQFKIVLKGIRPPVWRRFVVSDEFTLSGFHDVIQDVMGWTDSHLHQFFFNGKNYGMPDPELDTEKIFDDRRVRLSNLRLAVKDTLRYEYDFGDGWEHVLTVEKILDKAPAVILPPTLKGARACPPEDCGGIWGYENLLDILADQDHEEYESTIVWLPEDFDPERFDPGQVNRMLSARTWKVKPAKRK